jgi:hypothetical protein
MKTHHLQPSGWVPGVVAPRVSVRSADRILQSLRVDRHDIMGLVAVGIELGNKLTRRRGVAEDVGVLIQLVGEVLCG